jgi:hypothetical protein
VIVPVLLWNYFCVKERRGKRLAVRPIKLAECAIDLYFVFYECTYTPVIQGMFMHTQMNFMWSSIREFVHLH